MTNPEDILSALTEAKKDRISIRETLSCIMHEFGGSAGYARQVRIVYDDTKGANTKASVLVNILRALQAYGADEATEEENIEELEALAKELLEREPPDEELPDDSDA